ncbi:MAG: YdcF family protein [Deltaproteobacteria bacterium]|nr:YdcF family protein [Deltaproteobacteria bacterium]MBW2324270.1 YdcF family protein [Deltaproteobacteria bacterium]
MFWVKKIVSKFLFPIPLCLEILLFGLILLFFTSKKKLGKAVICLGVILLAAFSFSPLADMLLAPLEYKYPKIENLKAYSGVRWIVVLGGGHKNDLRTPVTSRLVRPTLVRVVEAVRIHCLLPHTKLILSEGALPGQVSGAEIMADLALALGIDKASIVLEPDSRDTKDQARRIKKMIGKDRFFLVTSASHMPRSMALFEKRDMRPIPAPTDHLFKKDPAGRGFKDYFPNAEGIFKTKVALYEYMGLIWARIRGQI